MFSGPANFPEIITFVLIFKNTLPGMKE